MSSIVIPPMPIGDPAGMRELATICKNAAAKLGPLGDDVTAIPKQMTFEGDAAHSFANRMQAAGARISSAAQQLQHFAGQLDSAAAEVERQIAAREAALQRLAEEEHHHALR